MRTHPLPAIKQRSGLNARAAAAAAAAQSAQHYWSGDPRALQQPLHASCGMRALPHALPDDVAVAKGAAAAAAARQLLLLLPLLPLLHLPMHCQLSSESLDASSGLDAWAGEQTHQLEPARTPQGNTTPVIQ